MWESGVQISSSQELGSQALYLAQAGIERAKIEVFYGYWPTGSEYTTTINNQSDLDISGDNYQFRYDMEITTPDSGNTRTIRATGRILDLANNEIVRRRIEIAVDDIQDLVDNVTGLPPPDGIDDDLLGTQIVWSWVEI